jgi:hypothetical protein
VSREALVIILELEAAPHAYFVADHAGGTCRACSWAASQREALIAEIDAALEAAIAHCGELRAA